MKKIIVDRIMETTYEDDSVWVEYRVNGKFGYVFSYEIEEDQEEDVEKIYNTDKEINSELANKPHVSICSDMLRNMIEECRQSENEMWYVDNSDLKDMFDGDMDKGEKFIEELKEEVDKLGIKKYVEIDGFWGDRIVIYGGIYTKFLF